MFAIIGLFMYNASLKAQELRKLKESKKWENEK